MPEGPLDIDAELDGIRRGPTPLINPELSIQLSGFINRDSDIEDMIESFESGTFNLDEAVQEIEEQTSIEVENHDIDTDVNEVGRFKFKHTIDIDNNTITFSGFQETFDLETVINSFCNQYSEAMPSFRADDTIKQDCPINEFVIESVPSGLIVDDRRTVQTRIKLEYVISKSEDIDIDRISENVNKLGSSRLAGMLGVRDPPAVNASVTTNGDIKVIIGESSIGSIGLGKLDRLFQVEGERVYKFITIEGIK